MIITVGALFLLDQNSYMGFDRTWPVILLVAGLFSFLSRSASIEGHVQPYSGSRAAIRLCTIGVRSTRLCSAG